MSAVDTVEALLRLGVAVKTAYSNAQTQNSSIDWSKFLTSPDFQAIQSDVNNLVARLTQTDLDQAIAAMQQKEAALLGNQSPAQLPMDKLLQYSDLVHTESLLVNRKVKSITATQEALSWLVDTLLPTLVSVAKVIIPLLV